MQSGWRVSMNSGKYVATERLVTLTRDPHGFLVLTINGKVLPLEESQAREEIPPERLPSVGETKVIFDQALADRLIDVELERIDFDINCLRAHARRLAALRSTSPAHAIA